VGIPYVVDEDRHAWLRRLLEATEQAIIDQRRTDPHDRRGLLGNLAALREHLKAQLRNKSARPGG
jgi:hypothetical protein